MIRFGILLLFAISTFVGLSCGDANKPANVAVNSVNTTAPATPLPSATVDELASGKKLYLNNCAACHKENGTGGEVTIEGKKLNPDNLTDAKRKALTDDKIIRVMMDGIEDEGMPSFKGKMSEAEMRDLVKYVRVEIQKMPAPAAPKS
jgi:mono/diheme cytochrome c family protein